MTVSDLKKNEYADYHLNYLNSAGNIQLIEGLKESGEEAIVFFNSIPSEKQDYVYAEGKWTIKELLLHIIDVERVFSYRALRFARQDKTELPGFDEGHYTKHSLADTYEMGDLLKSYEVLRKATLNLFESFTSDMLLEIGHASGANMSVRAAGFMIIGHEKHHCAIIKERYL